MADHERSLDERANDERDAGDDPRTPAHPEGDRDLRLDRILGFAGGLAVLLVGVAITCLVIFGGLKRALVREDPPPPPLLEASEPAIPPEPRLQESPVRDMGALRARDEATLGTYGWVDKNAGVGRIPIERAIELRLTPGLRPAHSGDSADGGVPEGGAP